MASRRGPSDRWTALETLVRVVPRSAVRSALTRHHRASIPNALPGYPPNTLRQRCSLAVPGLGINSSILSFSSFHPSEPTGVATFPGPLPGLAAPLPQASCRMPHASCRMPLDPLSPLLTRPWMLCQAFATHTTLLLLDHDARPYDQDLLARARQALAPEDEQPAHQAGKHAR